MKRIFILFAVVLLCFAVKAQWTTNPPSTKTNITGAASAPAVLVNSSSGSATNLTLYGATATADDGVAAGTFTTAGYVKTGNGLHIRTNALINWPAAALHAGGAWIGMSNHVVYLLTSTPGSTTWAATNKLGP